ncbi:MAG: cytochrome c oxidase subunit 3 [Proteobacteria bacterium]|nr:cytochrome c oxidase subunit 3 [Pseudomonadota bacterium]
MPTPPTFDTPASGAPRIPGEAGIWAFVVGDLLVFSVFFVLIALGQAQQPEEFSTSRAQLNLWAGVVNTLLLLSGSWCVATGVERCRSKRGGRHSRLFGAAIVCGFAFVINKIFEWGGKIALGLSPMSNDFYMYFFIFTGIHLLHVLVGLAVLGFLLQVSRRPELTSGDIRTLESGAIFWHLVDLLWIVLFALLYLL